MTTKTTIAANEQHESMFDAVLARLDVAANICGISEEVANILRSPQKQVKVSIDEKILKEIAGETGGQYFRAKDNDGLNGIYATINQLEKSKVDISTSTKFSDKFLPFAAAAALFLLIEILLRYLVFRKFP